LGEPRQIGDYILPGGPLATLGLTGIPGPGVGFRPRGDGGARL